MLWSATMAETDTGHFSSLLLRDHKMLKKVELHDLGRINVICGKNNSGKTTILESIKADNRISGCLFTEDYVAEFARRVYDSHCQHVLRGGEEPSVLSN